jgi:hypothetical protein
MKTLVVILLYVLGTAALLLCVVWPVTCLETHIARWLAHMWGFALPYWPTFWTLLLVVPFISGIFKSTTSSKGGDK